MHKDVTVVLKNGKQLCFQRRTNLNVATLFRRKGKFTGKP
jgi:hypothetical protein